MRRIRKSLEFSQEDFAHILWVTWTTVNRWESGAAAPYGFHLRILQVLEHRLATLPLEELRCPETRVLQATCLRF